MELITVFSFLAGVSFLFWFFSRFEVRKAKTPQEEIDCLLDGSARTLLEAVLIYGRERLSKFEYQAYKAHIEKQIESSNEEKTWKQVIEEAFIVARNVETDNEPTESGWEEISVDESEEKGRDTSGEMVGER